MDTYNSDLPTAEAVAADAISNALKVLQKEFQPDQSAALDDDTEHSGDCDPDDESGAVDSGSFDQWMAEHAVLENSSTKNVSLESMWSAGLDSEHECDEVTDNERSSTDIHDQWARARLQWASGEAAEDDVISIGSSSAEEEEDEDVDIASDCSQYDEYAQLHDQDSTGMTQNVQDALEGFGQLVAMQIPARAEHGAHAEEDQKDVASAMLSLIQPTDLCQPEELDTSAAEPTIEPTEPCMLPTEPNEQTIEAMGQASLDEMRREIDESIERSKKIVDELTADVDVPASGELMEEEPSIDRLNTQIFILSGEIQQLESDKSQLTHYTKQLESDNDEYLQIIDKLENRVKELEAREPENEAIKKRMQVVASKVQRLMAELAKSGTQLRESRRAQQAIGSERDKIFGRCRELETELKRVEKGLESERWAYKRAKEELKNVRDKDANEQQRLALEARVAELERHCENQADRMEMGRERERVLSITLRAVEARLGDAQQRLGVQQPVPADESRAALDLQMIEERRQTQLVNKRLEAVTAELERERKENQVLAARVKELEERRKRKYEGEEGEETTVGDAARSHRQTQDGSPFSTPQKKHSGGMRPTLGALSAGSSPVWSPRPKPVTPKVNLRSHTATPPAPARQAHTKSRRASFLSRFL
ncbi:hypothetical protein EC988_002126 [Linderina pennispora]|nr:hypothetical protein EC988_002126 [Linderina pennispora]